MPEIAWLDWSVAPELESVSAVDAGTSERIALSLRSHISAGRILPGTQLSEDAVATAFGVSRNTLREAFRLLMRYRLVEHSRNRGVFVRTLTASDVVDIYRVRRAIEVAALSALTKYEEEDIRRIGGAIEAATSAREAEDWEAVAVANTQFHQAVVGLARSPRMTEIIEQVMAELRLSFHVMQPMRDFYLPYAMDNRRIYKFIRKGETAAAIDALDRYLARSLAQLVKAFEHAP